MADNPYGYKKSKNTYTPGQSGAFKLSRSKIDLFTECKRCFYIDRRYGVGRPQMPAFTLNIAVDALMKKEFDIHRAAGSTHPLLKKYKVDAVPFQHEMMDEWRTNFTGVQALYKPANFTIFGAVDDVWINPEGELMVVDYKATSKEGVVDKLEDTRWHNQYRKQMEVYQWLLKQNGFKVSDTGYFVYVNGQKDKEAFDAKLEFDVKLISYTGSQDWIPEVLDNIKKLLDSDEIPESGGDCDYCKYRTLAGETMKTHVKKTKSSLASFSKIEKQKRSDELNKIKEELLVLRDSPLYKYREENNYLPVIGEGNNFAKIMFVGEAPGKNEAKTGKPFCGAAGKILDELLNSLALDRKDVYITNIVKDRPQENRDPIPDEIEIYGTFLDRQIEIIQPQIVATLGRFSMKYIMERFKLSYDLKPISKAHGKSYEAIASYGKIKIVPLYHPAAAIYNQHLKYTLIKDFKVLKNV